MKAFRTVLLCMVSWRFTAGQQPLRCSTLWGKGVCGGQLSAGSLSFDSYPAGLPAVRLPSFPAFPKPKPADSVSIIKVTTSSQKPIDRQRVIELAKANLPSQTNEVTFEKLQPLKPVYRSLEDRPRVPKPFATSFTSTKTFHGIQPDASSPQFTFNQTPAEKVRPFNFYQFLQTGNVTPKPTASPLSSFHIGPSPTSLPLQVPVFKIPNLAPASAPAFKLSSVSLPAANRPGPSPHVVRIPAVNFPAKESVTSAPAVKGSAEIFPDVKDTVASQAKARPQTALPTKYVDEASSSSDEDDGTLSLASTAPVRDSSPESSHYEYDFDGSSQQLQAQEPQQSASHYDAYIQEVQAAASGDNSKKGFSSGSGLRTIAVGSANQAKTALGNQAAAAYQAAYVAKNTLAQSAAQASATAQAALAGKQVILSGLEQQVRDAKVALQGEEMQLQQAKRAAQSAAQAAQQAMHQQDEQIAYLMVNVIQAALNAAQATSENANEAASQAAGELGAQTAMVGAARQRLQTLQEQLHGVRIDFEATQSAARKAQAAAQQAQANAAAAAAKAAAAGLGQKDSAHEGTTYQEYKVAPAQEQNSQEYYTQSDYHH